MSSGDKVWLIEDAVVGELLQYGFQFSLIKWIKDGIEHQEYLENAEFLDYKVVNEKD